MITVRKYNIIIDDPPSLLRCVTIPPKSSMCTGHVVMLNIDVYIFIYIYNIISEKGH